MRSLRGFLLVGLLVVSSLGHGELRSGPPNVSFGCPETDVLINRSWPVVVLNPTGSALGEWQLPIHPDKPDQLSKAQVRLVLKRDEETSTWNAFFYFSYPASLGLMFNIEKISVEWGLGSARQVREIDLSKECSNLGFTLKAGSPWDVQIKLGEFVDYLVLPDFTFKLWGQQG